MGLLSRNYITQFLAPAVVQSFMSILVFASKTVVGADLFWEALAFLSFQIAQIKSMVREAITLWFGVEGQVMDVQSFIEGSVVQPTSQEATMDHILLE